MYHYRRPRLECRVSMDEEDLRILHNEGTTIYNTIEFINAWENYDEYRKCNSTKACVLSSIDQKIVRANEEWEKICGYSHEKIQGEDFSIFQGEKTDTEACKTFVHQLRDTGYAKMTNINYDRHRTPIRLFIEGFKIKFNNLDNNIQDENMPYFWSTIEVA